MPVSPRSSTVRDKDRDSRDYKSPPADVRRSASESPLALAGLIESQIIPRLLVACRNQAVRPDDISRDRICATQAEGFAAVVLRLEAHALMGQVEGFIARGASVEAVLIDLLAPAARQIGLWWEEDACDFVDVTMGLWRLQQIVYELSARLPGKAPVFGQSRKAIFSVFPGSDHSFGTVIVEECFRREGWQTSLLTSATDQQLINMVAEQHYDVIGLTITHDDDMANAPSLIGRIRARSRNPMLGVIVGGRIFTQSPELAMQIGADATAADAEQAVKRAEILLRVLDEQVATRS
jgi:MerR family transcriptional regulator, light-induced transcriptional regulator